MGGMHYWIRGLHILIAPQNWVPFAAALVDAFTAYLVSFIAFLLFKRISNAIL